MTDISISVIVCSFGRRELLLSTLRSVFDQTDPAEEVIVALDGDVDGSREAVSTQFPQAVISVGPNLGKSMAFNRAARLASGRYLALVDDDDLFMPNKLERVREYLAQHPGCAAVNHYLYKVRYPGGPEFQYGQADYSAPDPESALRLALSATPTFDWSYLHIAGMSHQRLLDANRGAYSSTVLRRSVAIEAGLLNPSLAYSEDWSLFVNVSRLAEWHTIPEHLGIVGHHSTRPGADLDSIILASKVAMWHGGRTFPHRVSTSFQRGALASFGLQHRIEFRHMLWGSLRGRRFRSLRTSVPLMMSLLPRMRDRVGVAIPPRLSRNFDRIFK